MLPLLFDVIIFGIYIYLINIHKGETITGVFNSSVSLWRDKALNNHWVAVCVSLMYVQYVCVL